MRRNEDSQTRISGSAYFIRLFLTPRLFFFAEGGAGYAGGRRR